MIDGVMTSVSIQKFLELSVMCQDWELESMTLFLNELYLAHIFQGFDDKVVWSLSKSCGFCVKDFYMAFKERGDWRFPLCSIWSIRVLPWVAFFGWTATLNCGSPFLTLWHCGWFMVFYSLSVQCDMSYAVQCGSIGLLDWEVW